jgi:hypothetical protein
MRTQGAIDRTRSGAAGIALLIAALCAVTSTGVARADEGAAPLLVSGGAHPDDPDEHLNRLLRGARARVAHGEVAPSPRPRWNRPPDAFSDLLRTISDNTPVTALETNDPQALPGVVRRAARRALGKVLRDSTGLSDLFNHESHERESESRSSSSSGSGDDRVRFRVGVSHLAPKVEMRCATGGGALGVSIGALGQMAVDLSPKDTPGAQVHAGYDRSAKRLDLLFRLTY